MAVIVAIACLGASLAAAALAAKPHQAKKPGTELVSVGNKGKEKKGQGDTPSVSADGSLVAFASLKRLTSDDHNGVSDIYVRDGKKGKTRLASLGSKGKQGSAPALPVGPGRYISGNGRFVLFSSKSKLTSDDDDNTADFFLRDMKKDKTTLVNRDFNGNPGPDVSQASAALSADARLIAFSSLQDYGEGGPPLQPDAFVYDRSAGTSSLVSQNSMGNQANDFSSGGDASDDGLVAFGSIATNLGIDSVENPEHEFQIYVRDLEAETTTPVSVAPGGDPIDGGARDMSITPSGRYVAFTSTATNLVEGDSNQRPDVFVRDLQTETTDRVSVSSSGKQGNKVSERPSICDDGRYVAFFSQATNLVKRASKFGGIYVHDMKTGKTKLASIGLKGAAPNDATSSGQLSGDCKTAVYTSLATNLIKGDDDGRTNDVYAAPAHP